MERSSNNSPVIYDVEHLATFSSSIAAQPPGSSSVTSTTNPQFKPTTPSSAGSSSTSSSLSSSTNDNDQNNERTTTTPKMALHRLFELEKSSGIWTQRMQIELKTDHLLIVDCEAQSVVERFPKASVCKPTAFNDQDQIYNNIIIFEIKPDKVTNNNDNTDDNEAKQRGELHIFQCVSHQAQQVVDDIVQWKKCSDSTTASTADGASKSGKDQTDSANSTPTKPVLISSASASSAAAKDLSVVNVSVKDTVNVFNQIAAQREKAAVASSTKPTSPVAATSARLSVGSVSSSSSSSVSLAKQTAPPVPPPLPHNNNGHTRNGTSMSAKGPRAILDGANVTVPSAQHQGHQSNTNNLSHDLDLIAGHSSALSSRQASSASGQQRSGHHNNHHNHHNHNHNHHSHHQHQQQQPQPQPQPQPQSQSQSQQHQLRDSNHSHSSGDMSHSHRHKRRHEGAPEAHSVSPPLPPSSISSHQIDQVTTNEAYVSVLNHCFDDIEKFILHLQNALHAQRELRSLSASSKGQTTEVLLSQRARGPNEDEYFEILAKFKLAFNLLAKLKSCIHEPNAPELVHFIFTPLAIIIEAARNARPIAVDPTMVGVPYLCQDAIDLLSNCCTSKESDIWHSLGPNWTQTIQPHLLLASRLPKSFQPIFGDGWGPVITDLELVGLVMPPHANISDEPIVPFDPKMLAVDRANTGVEMSDESSDLSNPATMTGGINGPLPPPPPALIQSQSQYHSSRGGYSHHQQPAPPPLPASSSRRPIRGEHSHYNHSSVASGDRQRPRPSRGAAPQLNRHSTGSQMAQRQIAYGSGTRDHHFGGSPPPMLSPTDLSMGADDPIMSRSKSAILASHSEKLDAQQSAWLNELLSQNSKIVKVLYPRTANNDKELTVYRGEILEVLDDSRKWWRARNCHGEVAHVPHTIVAELNLDRDQHLDQMMAHNMSNLSTSDMGWVDHPDAMSRNHPSNWPREKAGAFRYF